MEYRTVSYRAVCVWRREKLGVKEGGWEQSEKRGLGGRTDDGASRFGCWIGDFVCLVVGRDGRGVKRDGKRGEVMIR